MYPDSFIDKKNTEKFSLIKYNHALELFAIAPVHFRLCTGVA